MFFYLLTNLPMQQSLPVACHAAGNHTYNVSDRDIFADKEPRSVFGLIKPAVCMLGPKQ